MMNKTTVTFETSLAAIEAYTKLHARSLSPSVSPTVSFRALNGDKCQMCPTLKVTTLLRISHERHVDRHLCDACANHAMSLFSSKKVV